MARRTAAAAAQTRAEVISAARKLFAESGYSGTTTAQVALKAGVTVGAVFHHFKDKSELFGAVFDQLDAEMDAHARLRARKVGGLKGFLEGFRAFLEFAQNKDYNRVVLVEAPVVLSSEIWLKRDMLRGLKTISRGVEALIDAGDIPRQPVTPLAILLLGAMNESGFALARGEAGVTINGCVQAMERLLRGKSA